MTNGSRISPQDAQEAISFIADHKTVQVSEFRKGGLAKLESKARHTLPELREIRGNLRSGPCETRAKLHIPLPKELLKTQRKAPNGVANLRTAP